MVWESSGGTVSETMDALYWETMVDGKVQASGMVNLTDVGRELPTEVSAGTIKVKGRGMSTVTVKLMVDESETTAEGEYRGKQPVPFQENDWVSGS